MINLLESAPGQLNWPDKIAWLAACIAGQEGALVEDDEFEVTHSFKGVWYIREIYLPADYVFVGRTHLQGHIVKLLNGSAFLYMPNGSPLRYCAPAVIHTQPNFQTVAYTITPVVAQSWHLNPEQVRDIKQLEEQYFGEPAKVLERGNQIIKELSWQAPSQLLPQQ